MFLDPEGQAVKQELHSKFASYFSFAYGLNRYANELSSNASISDGDLQQLLLAPLMLRGLTTFQGCILLLERGLSAEAKILARSLLEILFRITAIAKNRENAEIYVLEDQPFRRKLINKSKLLSPCLRQSFETEQTEHLAREIKSDIEERNIAEKSTQWWAQEAGLSDLYNSAYPIFSLAVHVGSRELESHLVLDKDRRIVAMKIDADTTNLDLVVISACESLLLVFEAASTILPENSKIKMSIFKTELAKLNETFMN
ncbi:DUF5677 domain-containing protein [Methylomonas methanica]|uniref:Uncharacterized protein n=1 Tax=Methylomonas methanica TaxID=421 RepID=A0A177MVF2_METMH|nr:DUF5677 domain-containing protein [Methylomonas methanica]OAI09686.1 hypothetical protein A1332_05780 [Methylomonas methanica]